MARIDEIGSGPAGRDRMSGSSVTAAPSRSERIARMLRPGSAAFVGVSDDEQKYGSRLFRSTVELGFPGELYAVNPRPGSYLDYDFLPSLSSIGHPVDLVVVSVPSIHCGEIVAEARELGCAGAVVVATGFAEIGQQALQDELLTRSGDMPVVGPNSMGLVSHPVLLSAIGDATIPVGRVAVVTQSGSVGVGIYDAARRRGLGLSYFVSLGNQADVTFADIFPALAEDEHTDSVLVYVEGFRDLAGFLDAASELSAYKPVAVLRGGRSQAGVRSAASHTASMSGDGAIASAALRRAGLVEVGSTRELLLAAMAFGSTVPMRGRSVSVVADSGGYATLGADAAEQSGLAVLPHSESLRAKLRGVLVPQASVANPVDMIGGPELRPDIFQAAVGSCLADPGIDGVALLSAFGGWGDFGGELMAECERAAAFDLVDLRDQWAKPLVLQSIYADRDHSGIHHLREHGIPVVDQIGDAMFILQVQASRSESARLPRRAWATASLAQGSSTRVLREDESRRWLEGRLDTKLPRWSEVTSADEALAAAAQLGGPAAIKVLAHAASHKSDHGGVHLNLAGDGAVLAAWREVARLCDDLGEQPRALVTGYLTGLAEAIVGVYLHAALGPVVLVGTGGVFAEALADQALLFPPFDDKEAESAIDRLSLGRILRSTRSAPRMKADLIGLVVAAGRLAREHPELAELDLNPVLLSHRGADVLDARVALAGDAERAR